MHKGISHLLQSLFAPAVRRPGKNRRIPTLEVLENRTTPTVDLSGNAADFRIDITENETVEVGRTDNFKFRVTVNGEDRDVQQAASSIEKITITATNNAANSLSLAGIHLADFVSLNTVVVKIDARDTVNKGAGWNPAGSQMIDGQRFLVFTQGNATLKITDLTPPAPPAPPALPAAPPPRARGIHATLVRKKARGKLVVRVSYADTGEIKGEFFSPLQNSFTRVKAFTKDSNGDGVADTIVFTGLRNGRKAPPREVPG